MKRDIVTIDDLTNSEIREIFSLAEDLLKDMSIPDNPDRIQGRSKKFRDDAANFILSTLFYEPSTRTRLSFESAMTRLGGQVISSQSASATSAAKGETIADTVRVVENYADIIVIRHPKDGAARVAADFAKVPVVNAGDGSHEHPTQTLCDLFTLMRDKRDLSGLKILLYGDLKNGRTVHSLVYGLARFGATMVFAPANSDLGLPQHVLHRLQTDFGFASHRLNSEEFGKFAAVYVTPETPHQLALFADPNLKPELLSEMVFKNVDACYVTRVQVERFTKDDISPIRYPTVNKSFLKDKIFRNAKVLHPLPRVDELGYDMDKDDRGVYFKQASYGIPVRMALIAGLLRLASRNQGAQLATDSAATESIPAVQADFLYSNCENAAAIPKEKPRKRFPVYTAVNRNGLCCSNLNCVTNDTIEQKHLKPRFLVISEEPEKKPSRASSKKCPSLFLRCVYCEHEVTPLFIGKISAHKYHREIGNVYPNLNISDLIFFGTEEQAIALGYRKYLRVPTRAKSDDDDILARHAGSDPVEAYASERA